MSKATSPLKLSSTVAAAAVAIFLGANAALAQSKPDTENGRYALSPIADGVLRLDTRTGAVSTCNNSGAGWACYAVPDERDGTVTGKVEEALPKSDPLKKPEPKVAEGERKIEIPLPSDRDMDRMMAFLEKAWRRLIEMANRVQKDVNGKI